MDCPNCGKQNSGDFPLCSSCGWVLCWKPAAPKTGLSKSEKHLLIGMIAIAAIIPLLWSWYRRSPAMANWVLGRVGIAPLLASRYDCRIITDFRWDTFLSGWNSYDTYVRFRSDPDTIAEYVRRSRGLEEGPTEVFEEVRCLIQGSPHWPDWHKPEAITRGRYYCVVTHEVEVATVCLDDDSNTVYLSAHITKLNLIGIVHICLLFFT